MRFKFKIAGKEYETDDEKIWRRWTEAEKAWLSGTVLREAASVSSKAPLTRTPLYTADGRPTGRYYEPKKSGSHFGSPDASGSLSKLSDSEHDEDVPLDSFKSDVKRKVALRQIMSKPDAEGERWSGGRGHGGSRSLAEPEPRGALRNRSRIRDEERSATGETEEIVEPAMRDRRKAWSKAGEGILDELLGDDDKDYCNPDSDDYDPDKCEERAASEVTSPYGMSGNYDSSAPATSSKGDKLDKESVNYRYAGNPEQKCGNCKHFVSKTSTCEIVAGLIRASDVCDKWAAGPAVEAIRAFRAKYKKNTKS